MKIFARIIKIMIWIIVCLIILFNIYSFVSVKIFKNSLVTINGYSFLEVVSGSMEPNIKVGDIIIINTKEKNYKEKDVITFKDINGSFVTHRIIEIDDKGIVTKGDANDTNDKGLLTYDDIVGVYVKKISSLGLIISSLKNPITLITILIIGIIVCILKNTDKEGNPLDVTEEYKEFLLYKEQKKKNNNIEDKKSNLSKDISTKTKKTNESNTSTKTQKTNVKEKTTKTTNTNKSNKTQKSNAKAKTAKSTSNNKNKNIKK